MTILIVYVSDTEGEVGIGTDTDTDIDIGMNIEVTESWQKLRLIWTVKGNERGMGATGQRQTGAPVAPLREPYSSESGKTLTDVPRNKTSLGVPLEIKLEPLWPIWLVDRRAWKRNQTCL